MDGPLDWYLLGVVLGFGVLAGVGAVGAVRNPAWVLLALAAAVPGVALSLVALPWWSLVVLAAAALLAFLGLRRLSTEALPAAALAALVHGGDPGARIRRGSGDADRRRAARQARRQAVRGPPSSRQGLT